MRSFAENGITVPAGHPGDAGGVTVSYFEWVQGFGNYFWDKEARAGRLQRVMEKLDEVNARRMPRMRLPHGGICDRHRRVAQA